MRIVDPRLVLNFAMHRVTAKVRIVLLLFDALGLELLVARGHIARHRFVFLARFGAFQNDGFSWHGW